MSSSRRREFSPYWDGKVSRDKERPDSGGSDDFTRSLRALIEKVSGAQPDSSNPVTNGATAATQKPWMRGLLADLATQLPRVPADIGLIASIANTNLFDGGLVDDKTYQMEKIIKLAASLPTDSRAQSDLSQALIKVLWDNLQHPPISFQDPKYKYRTADGSNNNIMYPDLGKAGSSYARTVTPKTLQPGVLPDPGVIFDALYARDEYPREHPNKISSMLFYLASIIIHDVFYTDPRNTSKVKTSSYLDLAPLYGSSDDEQARVRTFRNGRLKPDTFNEARVLGFPPGVAALLVCFNRYHNYVAIQLKDINENGRFTPPADLRDKNGLAKLDEDLFQTARLVTCGLYVNIILNDYVRTILNLNRADSTWTLDPRDTDEFFDGRGVPQGIGNQVSAEFNLIYRWHSSTSVKDEKWTEDTYEHLFPGKKHTDLTTQEFVRGVRKWLAEQDEEPSKWALDFGRYKRTKLGTFRDQDLADILTDATEDVSCAFGARQVPVVMKLIEVLGIEQARNWNVATLNEFRTFFGLEPHKSFSDISSHPEVQHALKALYKDPDYVELYPGLVAEDAKESMVPGSGICLGFTTSRTILSDAVALVRGDRFYTVDYSPANLTNWGFNQIKSDPAVAQGHCIYNLFMRALPNYYRGNSVYAMFPFVIPRENRQILRDLGKEKDYIYDRPVRIRVPLPIRSWSAVTKVLGNHAVFKVPWGDHIRYLTGHDYMLGNDKPKSSADRKDVYNAIYCPVNGMDEIRKFYEATTRQLIVIGQERLRDEWFQLDVCRDVAQPAHTVFIAKVWHIPLKLKGDDAIGIEVEKLYLAMSLMFAFVFLDGDTARSFKLATSAKKATDELKGLMKIVCGAIKTGEVLHVSRLFDMLEEGQMLEEYGKRLIRRMFENGWDVDTVVANLIPTAAAACGLQAQHMTQMIDLYLSKEYHKKHWSNIQRLAHSDNPEDFELLKSYALEANRLRPASYGLLRRATERITINDEGMEIEVEEDDQLYTDFIQAGRDENVFPDPLEIKLDRPRASYIHHGWGMHACIGREIVEIAMAAQLKVFAQLKNLRRAPGPQGHMKYTYPQPNPLSSHPEPPPGKIKVFMKEDWGDFWPFPTTLKLHHDGFYACYEDILAHDLILETGVPEAPGRVIASSRENSQSRSSSHSRHSSLSQVGDESNSVEEANGVAEAPSDQPHSETLSNDPPLQRAETYERDLAYGEEGHEDTAEEIDMSGILNGDSQSRSPPRSPARRSSSFQIQQSPPPKLAVNGHHLDPSSATRRDSLDRGRSGR